VLRNELRFIPQTIVDNLKLKMRRINKIVRYYEYVKKLINDPFQIDGHKKSQLECNKKPSRTEIINFLLSLFNRETSYLEIGVRKPNNNFNHIRANKKYGVDPDLELNKKSVDFKITSDSFFEKLNQNEILSNEIKFDVIFIDGLHLAEQVNRDIKNSMDYIKDDGFIVLHDCNPPTEWHSREEYKYTISPAKSYWNGTTWKAFLKWRFNSSIKSCCIDTDWGIGILSKKRPIGQSIKETNLFYEFNTLEKNRIEYLNLIDFEKLKHILTKAEN
jgi:hypothetical protein